MNSEEFININFTDPLQIEKFRSESSDSRCGQDKLSNEEKINLLQTTSRGT